jgi:hypothetical protein
MAEDENFDVTIAKPKSTTGGMTFAPKGTEIPEDASSSLPDPCRPLGYVSADGVSLSEDASDEDVTVWGGVKVRKVRSEYSATITATLHSTRNVPTLRAIFGKKNVIVKGNVIKILHTADIAPVQCFTIESLDGEFARRFHIPRGQVTVSGERTLSHSSPDGFEITIEALADEDGVCYIEYSEETDGQNEDDEDNAGEGDGQGES